jgi:secreted trypsin-like serine protease
LLVDNSGFKSSCQGDSGGPVFGEGETQYGLSSNGWTVCETDPVNPFAEYIKVSAHREDFIDPIVRAHSAAN